MTAEPKQRTPEEVEDVPAAPPHPSAEDGNVNVNINGLGLNGGRSEPAIPSQPQPPLQKEEEEQQLEAASNVGEGSGSGGGAIGDDDGGGDDDVDSVCVDTGEAEGGDDGGGGGGNGNNSGEKRWSVGWRYPSITRSSSIGSRRRSSGRGGSVVGSDSGGHGGGGGILRPSSWASADGKPVPVARRRSSTGSAGEGSVTGWNASDTTRMSAGTSVARRNIWSRFAGGQQQAWDNMDAASEDMADYADNDNAGGGCWDWLSGACAWTAGTFRTAFRTPSILLCTLLVFGALCAASVAVVVSSTNGEEEVRMAAALEMAEDTGDFFSKELDKALLPLFTMSQFVHQLPAFHDLPFRIGDRGEPGSAPPEAGTRSGTHRNLTGVVPPDLEAQFHDIAAGIKKSADMKGVLVNVQLAPQAVVTLLHPLNNTEDFPPNSGVYLDSTGARGHDLLNDPRRVAIARATVPASGVVIAGPLTLIQGDFPVVRECFIARIAINMPGNVPPYDIEVDGKSYESWGFAVVLINWEALKNRSNIYARFEERKMFFRLTRTDRKYDNAKDEYFEKVSTIAESENAEFYLAQQEGTGQTAEVALPTTNNMWVMVVGYVDGSRPNWEHWGIPLAVIGSLLLSVLFMMILVAKKEQEELLFKMMPKRAIRKLRRGQTVVEKYSMVTIFFSDIVGFTSMAGEMTPEEVMDMLNELYCEFDKLVDKHDVYKVETIGDAYMVLGGAPKRRIGPEGAERVALFALDAIDLVKTFRTTRGDQIFIRAGLASGPVVAGVVGKAMPRYCLFGDTVNFASRMESTSKKMRIQCSAITARLLNDAPGHTFELEDRTGDDGKAGVEIKGKGRKQTFWIYGVSERVPVKPGRDSDLEGRDEAELDCFHEHVI